MQQPLVCISSRWYLLVLCLVSLFGVGVRPAHAAPTWKDGKVMKEAAENVVIAANEQLKKTKYGFDDRFSILGAVVKPKGSVRIIKSLEKGKGYVFIGGGSKLANDVDITIKDENGKKVAEDTEDDATPVVTYTPAKAGSYTIELLVADADASCFCMLVCMKDGGWDCPTSSIHDAVDNWLDTCNILADKAGEISFHQIENTWCLYGGIMEQGDSFTMSSIKLEAGKHIIFGETDLKEGNINLKLLDGKDKVLKEDDEGKKYPIIGYRRDTTNADYQIKVTAVKVKEPALVLLGVIDLP